MHTLPLAWSYYRAIIKTLEFDFHLWGEIVFVNGHIDSPRDKETKMSIYVKSFQYS